MDFKNMLQAKVMPQAQAKMAEFKNMITKAQTDGKAAMDSMKAGIPDVRAKVDAMRTEAEGKIGEVMNRARTSGTGSSSSSSSSTSTSTAGNANRERLRNMAQNMKGKAAAAVAAAKAKRPAGVGLGRAGAPGQLKKAAGTAVKSAKAYAPGFKRKGIM